MIHLERHQGRPPDVLHPNEQPRSARELERLLLGLHGVRSVTIAERPSPHVEALYVEVRPGRSEGRTIQQVRAAAWDKARVDIHPAQVHVLPGPGRRAGSASWIAGFFATARPRQWVKNLLVFGAPATGGVLLEPAALASAILAFVAFCLVASGVYFVNDVVDAPMDRQHPVKRFRPIASGVISPRYGAAVGAGLVTAGMVVAFAGGPLSLVGVVAGYAAISIAYTYVLRSIALIDIAAIAGGFLLRAVAGGVATGVPLSNWFLIVASFGSLFLAAGKRHAEYVRLGAERRSVRASLGQYTESYLRYIQFSASTIAIGAYTQWAFEGAAGGTVWSGLSIIPFVLAIFRYGLLLDEGRGAAPEDAVLADLPLLALGSLWVLLVALGVYLD